MTTKTASTRLEEVPPGPPFPVALAGAAGQLGALLTCWSLCTPAADCLASPVRCLLHPGNADPWGSTVVYTISFALLMWLVSLRTLGTGGTSDPSIVDRLWSILPPLYCWRWAQASGLAARPLLQAVLASVWGTRLTYNFWLKGGFSGGEDYRWAVVRCWYPGWRWEVFNLIFICLYQQVLILSFAAPAVTGMLRPEVPLSLLDFLAAALFLLLCSGEAIADRQMFAFQSEKYRRKAAGEALGPYELGFIDTGLWALSRHPNYFCEVSMWWCFYLFSVTATGHWVNWSVLGPILLSCLFVAPNASLDLAEAISGRKYPGYAAYQKRVSRFFPMPAAASRCQTALQSLCRPLLQSAHRQE